MAWNQAEEDTLSPASLTRYHFESASPANLRNLANLKSIFDTSRTDKIKVDTTTSVKKVNIRWHINKRTLDIAKLSGKGDKKGVITASLKHDVHRFNLELCVPGWRRSQDGFSAFYLTVPKLKINHNQLLSSSSQSSPSSSLNSNNNNHIISSNNENDEDMNDGNVDDDDVDPENQNSDSTDNNNNMNSNRNQDFVARYTVEFGATALSKLVRVSSIRNDFDLGVGFPNFTEVSTLMAAISDNQLIFDITVEIFLCESTIKKLLVPKKPQSPNITTMKLMENLYYKRLHSDVLIICSFKKTKRTKRIKVHKCILTTASPVFYAFFKHKCKESETSTIVMNQWSIDVVEAMIKFLYLGIIDLNEHNNHNDDIDAFDDDDEVQSEKENETDDLWNEQEEIENDANNDELITCLDEYDEKDGQALDDEEDDINADKDKEERKFEESYYDSASSSISSVTTPKDKTSSYFPLVPNADDTGNEINELQFECPQSIKTLFELFEIAECYELHHLLIECCHKLISYLTVDTSCILLMYLEKYDHVKEIKEITNLMIQYISQNIKLIKKSNGYSYLLKHRPSLIAQLIDALSSKSEN